MGTPPADKNVLYIRSGDNSKNKIAVRYDILRRAVLVLRAINHPLRQEMIRLLDEKGSMTVTEIYIKLRLEQSVASQHLAILRRAGFLLTEREGKYIHYSLNKDRIKEVASFTEGLVND